MDKMRVYFNAPWFSRGINRVIFELERYLPDDFVIADDPGSADLVVFHINGRHDHNLARVKSVMNNGHKYAIIQYVLKSCRNPKPEEWYDIWGGARVVWSYYPDLEKHCPNLYHAPLAALPDKFYREPKTKKKYMLGTMGVDPKSECFGEARLAVFNAGGKMIHVGKKFAEDPVITYADGVSDDELRHIYNQCQWFSVLRRADGFEMIGLESLLCGTRPILFDTPNYRQWYSETGRFIPESSVFDTVIDLTNILKGKPDPVRDDEIEFIKERFDWKTIIDEFWRRCRF